jgi:hypothetical protein
MIKHIVLWKLDTSYSESEKTAILKTFKEKLLGLERKIPELKSITVNFNSKDASADNFDIMLETDFTGMNDLNTYQVHPEHLKVVEYVKSLKRERACLDFEY